MASKRNYGDDIRTVLQAAFLSGDYSEVDNLINNTVIGAVNQASKAMKKAEGNVKDVFNGTSTPEWARRAAVRQAEAKRRMEEDSEKNYSKVLTGKKLFKGVGSIRSGIYKLLGGFGIGICGFISLIFAFIFFSGGIAFSAVLISLFILLLCVLLFLRGDKLKKRYNRAIKYAKLCGDKRYEDIQKLADATDRPKQEVVRDLRKMINDGFFKEGHIDRACSCFMMSDEVYNSYLDLMSNQAEKEREEKEKISKTVEEEQEEIFAIGNRYIEEISELNAKIPGEEVSNKLYEMENILKQIFAGIKKHPEEAPKIKKLLDYYLPTTKKLLIQYEEFDKNPNPGPEIIEAKRKFEAILDDLNGAFREILNDLFKEAAWDASTDIDVLKTMISKDGYSNEMEGTVLKL